MTPYIYTVFFILSLFRIEVKSTPLDKMEDVRTTANIILNSYDTFKGGYYPNFTRMDITMGDYYLLQNLTDMGIDLTMSEESDWVDIKISKKIQIAAHIHDDLKNIFKHIEDINFLFNTYYLPCLHQFSDDFRFQTFVGNVGNMGLINPSKGAFKIYKIICPGELGGIKNSLLDKIVDLLNTNVNLRCTLYQSPQQFIYKFYHFIAKVELKAFIMTTFSKKMLSLLRYYDMEDDRNDYLKDMQKFTNEHLEKMENYLSKAQAALKKVTTEVSRCDTVFLDNYKIQNIKAINIKLQESDYQNNMVVTGVRFVVKNKLLHLQIEEGKLTAGGAILPGSERWIPIQDVDYSSCASNHSEEITEMHQCIEYHDIGSWDELHVSNLTAVSNFVIVGVNFDFFNTAIVNKKAIYIRFKYMEINSTTGHINSDNVKYNIVLLNSSQGLERFNISNEKVNEADNNIKPGYIQQNSNSENSILNQQKSNRTLVYLDSQALRLNSRLPLIAMTFYRTNDSINGDSLSLGIFTFDISSRIDAN